MKAEGGQGGTNDRSNPIIVLFLHSHFRRPFLTDVPELPSSDVTICIGEETVRTNRGYLSVYSTYFSEVFGSHSPADGEVAVVLNGIGADDFAEFLLAIYPNSKALDGTYRYMFRDGL